MAQLFKQPRSQQPQGEAQIDWGNPITRELRAAFAGGLGRDFALKNPDLQGGFTRKPTEQGLGLAYTSPGTGTIPAFLADSANLDLPVAHTVFALVKLANTNDQVIVQKGQNGVEYASWALGVGPLDGTGGSTSFTYKVRASNAAGFAGAFDPLVAPTGRVVALAGWHDGTNVRLFRDGSAVATTASSGSAPYNGAARVEIGGDNNPSASGGRWFISDSIPLVLLFGRALADAEIAALSANPWQVFTPRRIWVPVSAGGGGTNYTQSIAGSITSNGYIVKQTGKAALGIVDVFGNPIKSTTTSIKTGSITSSGATNTSGNVSQSTSGSITPSGAVSRAVTFVRNYASFITTSGTIVRAISKVVGGSITLTGSAFKRMYVVIAGSITSLGALATFKFTPTAATLRSQAMRFMRKFLGRR